MFANVSQGVEEAFDATLSPDCQSLTGSSPQDKDVIYRRR
jgi:hypothetical protein